MYILSEAEHYSQNPHISPRAFMRVSGVIFDHRGQYVEFTACNKSLHYQIWVDNIVIVKKIIIDFWKAN